MFKNFFLKKLAQSKMKNIPPEAQEKMMKLIEENPDLFSEIAGKAQAKMKEGKTQMQAMMEVMEEHKDELRKALE